ncbi:hypothetical protein KKF86_02785 [bacterium]|nr:hypothetical protein [bacterium]
MKCKTLIITLFLSFMVDLVYSQTESFNNVYFTIPEFALIDIEPNASDIIFSFDAPTEAGEQLESLSDNTKWLNYTSTVTIGGLLKNITAQITSSTIIPGLKIELLVSNYSGSGQGVLGTPVGAINLSTTAQTIITGIGGCFTNTGANSGHNLEYNVSINDYLVFEVPATPSIDIVFTISN